MQQSLQWDSPTVVFVVIPRDFAVSMNLLLANPLLSSVKNFSEAL